MFVLIALNLGNKMDKVHIFNQGSKMDKVDIFSVSHVIIIFIYIQHIHTHTL